MRLLPPSMPASPLATTRPLPASSQVTEGLNRLQSKVELYDYVNLDERLRNIATGAREVKTKIALGRIGDCGAEGGGRRNPDVDVADHALALLEP